MIRSYPNMSFLFPMQNQGNLSNLVTGTDYENGWRRNVSTWHEDTEEKAQLQVHFEA